MVHRSFHRPTAFVALLLGALFFCSPAEGTSAKKANRPAKPGSLAKKAAAKAEARNSPAPEPQVPASQTEDFEPLEHSVQHVRPEDTLPKLLSRLSLSEEDRKSWLRSLQKQFPSRKQAAGKRVHFYFQRPLAKPIAVHGKKSLKALEIELDDEKILSWEKGSKGIVFRRRHQPYETEIRAVSGTMAGSFFEEGQKLGISSSILSQLTEIFSWDIDFDGEFQDGDTFRLLYEVRSQRGAQEKISFRILAAELMSLGKKHFAVYFEKKEGQGNYYNLYGQSLARAFLRFPLEFNRISSPFSESRFHPIFMEHRPHNGVDFAAPRGTPVRAVADGAIDFAGWRKGGYGRTIELLHDAEYASRYAHLERLAGGIRKGARVKKGQIIGYVGSSGRTTGPHLHFELHRNGELLDPLSFDFPAADSIDPALLKIFEDAKELLLAQLAAARSS
jgi:murein DD-endopeptidase MepM/ murein hydrolase activator NlpD